MLLIQLCIANQYNENLMSLLFGEILLFLLYKSHKDQSIQSCWFNLVLLLLLLLLVADLVFKVVVVDIFLYFFT